MGRQIEVGAYEKVVHINMTLANEDVKMLHYSSAQITAPYFLKWFALSSSYL
jgi:hypothetical protein